MEWLGSEGVAGAGAIFVPWVGLWFIGKPRFLLLTSITDSSFGNVDAFPVSARCNVIDRFTWKFSHFTSPFSRFSRKQCVILLTVGQTGVAGEMLIIASLLEYFPIIYFRFLWEKALE